MRCFFLGFCLCSPLSLTAQDAPSPAGETSSIAANEKSLKYYEALLQRPQPGFLFDRFYNAWLDGETLEALEKFLQDKVTAQPSTPNRLLLAFFFAKQSADVKALEQFRAALEKDPANADIYHQKAVVEARTLDFDTALADLEKALAGKPGAELEIEIRQLQGKILARSGQNERAVEVWKKLVEDRPDDEDLQEDLLELQMTEALYDAAQATAETLIAKTKDPYKLIQRRLRLGDIHQRAGKRDKAVEIYTQCLDQVGSDSWLEKEVLSQVEQLFRQEDDMDGLKNFYTKLIEANPKRITVRRAYAKVLADQKESDAALKEFASILAVTPGERDVRDAYIDLLVSLEKKPEAIAQIKELIKLHPADQELPLRLAELQALAELPKECEATALAWLEKSDGSESAFHRVIALLERNKINEAALAVLEKLRITHPDSASAQETVAAGLHQLGKTAEAVAAWRKLGASPDKSRAISAARAAAARNEHQAAYEILKAREAEFGDDPNFLSQLCGEAILVSRESEALPISRKLVLLSKDASELDTALSLYLKMVDKADQTALVTKDLQDRSASLTAQEKCLLAELLDRGGKPKDAEQLLKSLEPTEPELAAILLVRLHSGRNDWQAAALAMKAFVATPAGRKAGYVQKLVELFERSSDLASALQFIPEWKKLAPGAAQAWIKEAALLTEQGKPEEAARVLRSATQQFGDDEDVRSKLAEACTESGKLADAERLLYQLYDEAKDTAMKVRWAGQLAEVATNSGKTEELIENFNERKRNNRASIVPLLSLAEIYGTFGDVQNRRKALMDATRLKPGDPELLLEISRIDEADGEIEQAISTLKNAMAVDKTGEARLRLARLYLENGREADANALLSQIAASPLDPRKAEELANGMASFNDWIGCRTFLDSHIQKHPNDYRLHYLMGVALEEDQQPQLALSHFLNVLGITQELRAYKSSFQTSSLKFNTQQDAWMESLKSLPAEIVQVQESIIASEDAYSYRQNRNSYSYSYSRYSTAVPRVSMPGKLDEAKKFALAHILSMGSLQEEKERDLLGDELVRQGFPNGRALLAVLPSALRFDTTLIESYLRDHPPTDFLHCMLVFSSYSNDDGSEESLGSAAEALTATHLELAVVAALRAATLSDEKQEQWLERTITLAEKIEKPTPFAIMALAYGLSYDDSLLDTLKPEVRQRFGARFASWLALTDKAASWREILFSALAAHYRGAKDYEKWVDLLVAETAIPVTANNQYFYGGSILGALQIPAESLPNFSYYLLQAMSGNSDYDDFDPTDEDFDREKARPIIANSKHPIVKLTLAATIEDDELAALTVEEILKAPEPSLDGIMLAAAWLAAHDKRQDAIAALQRAQFLPMTKPARLLIDSSIATWALELLEEGSVEPEAAPVLAAREAALRLRRGFLTADDRQRLTQAMEKLGMTSEAEALDKNSSALALGTGTSSANYYYNSAPTLGERLLHQGKTTEGIQFFLTDIRKEARLLVPTAMPKNANPNASRYYSGSSGNAINVLQPVIINGIETELLQAAEPAPDADAQKLGEFAAICEFFLHLDRAREFYEKALALKPDYHSARFRLAGLVARSDLALGFGMLKDVPADQIESAGRVLYRIAQDRMDFDTQLKLADVIHDLARHFSTQEKANLNWTSWLVRTISGPIQQNSDYRNNYYPQSSSDEVKNFLLREPSLIELPGNLKREDYADLTQAQFDEINRRHELRRTAYISICRNLSLMKGVPSWVFGDLQFVSDGAGLSRAELIEPALKSLTALVNDPIVKNDSYIFFFTPAKGGLPARYQPLRFLLDESLTDASGALAAKVMDILQKGKAPSLAREFKVRRELTAAPPDKFLEQARLLTQLPGPRSNAYWMTELMSFIVQTAAAQKSDPGMLEFILAEIKRSGEVSLNDNGNAPVYFVEYINLVAQIKGREAVPPLLEELALKLLGPKEKRPDELKKDSRREPLSTFAACLKSLMEHPDWSFTIIPFYEEEALRFLPKNYENRASLEVGNLARQHPLQNPNFFLPSNLPEWDKVLAPSGLLGAPDTFRTYSTHEGGTSLFTTVAAAMMADPAREAARAWLRKLPPTFGRDLLLQYWDEEALLQIIARNLPALQALPTERQSEIRLALSSSNTIGNPPPWASTEVRSAADWINIPPRAELEEDMGKIMTLKSAREAVAKQVNISEASGALLAHWRELDPTKARELFDKLKLLITEAEKANLLDDLGIYDNAPLMDLLTSAIAIRCPKTGEAALRQIAQALNFGGAIILNDKSPAGPRIPNAANLAEHFNSLINEGELPSHRYGNLLRVVNDQLLPEFYPVFLPALLQTLLQRDSFTRWLEPRRALINYVRAREQSGHLTRIAPLILPWLEASLRKRSEATPGEMAVELLSPDQKFIYDTLRDESIPFTLRLNYLEPVLESVHLDRPVLDLCGDLIQQSLTDPKLANLARETGFLGRFEQAEHNDAWLARARLLAPALKRRYPPAQVSLSPGQLEAMMVFLIGAGDMQSLHTLLRSGNSSTSIASWITLIKAQQYELATRVLIDQHQNFFYSTTVEWLPTTDGCFTPPPDPATLEDFGEVFSRKLEETVEDYIAKIPQEDMRPLARALLARMEDAKVAGREPTMKRDARLVALAREFPSLKFKFPQQREMVLSTLASFRISAEIIRAELETYPSHLAYFPLLRDDYLRNRKLVATGAALRLKLAAGESDAFAEFLQRCGPQDTSSDFASGQRSCIQSLALAAAQSLLVEARTWPEAQSAAFMTSIMKLLATTDQEEASRTLLPALLIHAADTSRMQVVADWWTALSPDIKSALRKLRAGSDSLPSRLNEHACIAGVTADHMRSVLIRLFHPMILDILAIDQNMQLGAFSRSLLPAFDGQPEAFAAAVEEILAANPGSAETASALWSAAMEADVPSAVLIRLERATMATLQPEAYRRHLDLLCEYARTLVEESKFDEAEKITTQIRSLTEKYSGLYEYVSSYFLAEKLLENRRLFAAGQEDEAFQSLTTWSESASLPAEQVLYLAIFGAKSNSPKSADYAILARALHASLQSEITTIYGDYLMQTLPAGSAPLTKEIVERSFAKWWPGLPEFIRSQMLP